jgi:hypothetical protein
MDLFIMLSQDFSRRVAAIKQSIKTDTWKKTTTAQAALTMEQVLAQKAEFDRVSAGHDQLINKTIASLDAADPFVASIARLLGNDKDDFSMDEKVIMKNRAKSQNLQVHVKCQQPGVGLRDVADDEADYGKEKQDLGELEEVSNQNVPPMEPTWLTNPALLHSSKRVPSLWDCQRVSIPPGLSRISRRMIRTTDLLQTCPRKIRVLDGTLSQVSSTLRSP